MRAPNPYDDLYIYLIDGTVSEDDEALLGHAYLGNWVEGDSSFLFFREKSDKSVDRMLAGRPDIGLIERHQFTYDQWQGRGLAPMKIGAFLIAPPWTDMVPAQGMIHIRLDPGVVFGNCLHPTTRHCLKALSWARGQRELGSVLDLGTGTGILALASAFLGARSVLAVDLNPLCVKTAKANVAQNGLEGVIQVVEGPVENFVNEPADLVAANIHYEIIRELLRKRRFGEGERFILSGLMRSAARDV
ncbi:MAG: methyltransferase domain-containing protein, partial [Deltaproteobacteria bacterium]|nr:methyltransferase domain-containing protein [Deltaproteobacteria bacterium]